MPTPARRLAVLVALTLLAGASQPPGQPPKEKQDPQSSYEPRSRPGAGQKLLERFVGEWDVVKTFYPRSGDPARAIGTCRQTMIHDGRFLQSEFTFEQNGVKTSGLGIIGFEPASGKFTSVWTDSRATRMSFRQSQDPFGGEEIVLFGKSLGADPNAHPSSRTVSKLEDNGNKLVHRQFAIDTQGKERLVMELLMTRKDKAKP